MGVLIPAVGLGLGGCAELQALKPFFLPVEAPEATAWDRHRASVGSVRAWTLQGRVAVETADDGWNATMTWEQRADHYALRLMAPLSQGTFELEGDTGGVTLRTAENETLTATDPEALMRDHLGWSLPVGGLKFWIRGIPDPDRPHTDLKLDESGRMTDLIQDGWRVSVLRYQKVGDKDLPDKLFLQNDPVKVRVVIGQWQPQS
jgi:outer membrane lipoprotein LolB